MSVHQLAEDFVTQQQSALSRSRFYALDYTLPSVGVLDNLTFELRGNPKPDRALLRGVSSYLAVMCERCWKAFGCTVVLSVDEQDGVKVTATSGPEIFASKFEGEESQPDVVELRIEQDLADLLSAMPRPVELLRGFNRIINPTDDWLSPFAVSVFTGLSPRITGAWTTVRAENWKEQIEKVTQHLATGCAEHYGKLFPDEPIGQMAEFYLNGLIFPLTELNELPLGRAAKDAGHYLKGLGVSKQQMRVLAGNLVRSGNDRIANFGFVLGAVLGDQFAIKEVLFHGSTLTSYGAMLRPAFSLLRTILNEVDDWAVRSENLLPDADSVLNEQKHFLLPWLRMDLEEFLAQIKKPRFRDLTLALISFEFDLSIRILDELIEQNPKIISFHVQRAFLDIVNGNFDGALAIVKKTLSEPEGESSAPLQLMAGNLIFREQKINEAEQYFKKAANLGVASPEVRTEALHNLGLIAEVNGDLDAAYEKYLESSSLNPCHASNLFALYRVVLKLGRTAETGQRKSLLQEIDPFDRNIFFIH